MLVEGHESHIRKHIYRAHLVDDDLGPSGEVSVDHVVILIFPVVFGARRMPLSIAPSG